MVLKKIDPEAERGEEVESGSTKWIARERKWEARVKKEKEDEGEGVYV